MSISETIPSGPLARTSPVALAGPPAVPPTLPEIEPGQLWLIEFPAVDGISPAPLHRTLARANVVIYDRALAGSVANLLSLGGYAEPAASGDEAGDPAAARALRFACDGWSVVRLLPARPTQRQRIARVRHLVGQLAAIRTPADIAVTVLGELDDGVCERTDTRLDRLDLVVVTYPRDARLTIVIAGIGAGGAARLHAVGVNGLAG